MAVRVDNGLALELGRAIAGFIDQEFAKQVGLALELLRLNIVAKEVGHLVAKDRDTAWFDSDDWRTGFNINSHGRERLFQRGFGLAEHAKVVERAPATERLPRDPDLISGVLQDFHRRFGDLRMEVVAEGIGPQDHRRTISVAQRALAEPCGERLRGQGGHTSLLRDAANPLCFLCYDPPTTEKIHQPGRDSRHAGPAL